MTPCQVLADKVQTPHPPEKPSEHESHHIEGESHKPNMRAPKMSANKDIVLLATKRDMREVCENPSHILHFVLFYKDEVILPYDSQPLPSAMATLLQESEDVFPSELPPGLPPLRDIEHHIDFNPGALLPNLAPYHVNPEETKEIQCQVDDLLQNRYV